MAAKIKKWLPLVIQPVEYTLAGDTICHEVCQNLCFKAQGIILWYFHLRTISRWPPKFKMAAVIHSNGWIYTCRGHNLSWSMSKPMFQGLRNHFLIFSFVYDFKMATKIQDGGRYSFKQLNIHLQGTQFVMKYVKTYVLRPKESFSDIFINVWFQDGRQNSKCLPLFIQFLKMSFIHYNNMTWLQKLKVAAKYTYLVITL